jgi:hypothetical protein
MTHKFQTTRTPFTKNFELALVSMEKNYPYFDHAEVGDIVGVCTTANRLTHDTVALNNVTFMTKGYESSLYGVGMNDTSHLHHKKLFEAYDYVSYISVETPWNIPISLSWPLYGKLYKDKRTIVCMRGFLGVLDDSKKSSDISRITENSILHFPPLTGKSAHQSLEHQKEMESVKHILKRNFVDIFSEDDNVIY